MNPKKKPRSEVALIAYFALGGLMLMLLGLVIAARYGGSHDAQMVYEGFN